MAYQIFFKKFKPDLVIEIGTNKGGSAICLTDLMEMNGEGIVHSINIHSEGYDLLNKHPRIKLFTEGWDKYDLKFTKDYEVVLVTECSSHDLENTLQAIS